MELVEYLEAELGEFMAPDWIWENVTPNDLWNLNRTLILSYAHDPSSAYNDKIWSEVQHAWGNKEKVQSCLLFLSKLIPHTCESSHPSAFGPEAVSR